MVKAIVFDFDGVLADTYEMNLQLAKDFDEYGINTTEQTFKDAHKGNVYEGVKTPFSTGETVEYLQAQKERFQKEHLLPLKHLLEELCKRFQLFIISSTIDHNLLHFLKIDNYHVYFEKIYGGTVHKSKKKKFEMLFSEYGVSAQECLFVTDTVGDIREGKAVGVASIAVTWGYHDTEDLHAEEPYAVVDTEYKLLEAINRYVNH